MTLADPPARRRLLALLLVALLIPLGATATTPPADEPLPTDPALVTGRLSNGLAYVVRPHRNPEGRVTIWLHVASGSLNETDDTQGLAHYLEHLAFNGSANFPPGSLVPFFQSLGLAFGRDQNAFTSFDQTTYQITVPGGGRDMLDKGMLYMADVARRLTLSQEAIDGERPVILEEKRAGAGARQRVREQTYAQLAPESTLGRRLPIGTEPTIKRLTRQDFLDYYARWYVPSNTTLLVVGDTDPALVVDVIRQHFGAGPTVPRPRPHDPGVQATPASRAIVVTDAELTRAEVSIRRLEPPRPPATTVAQRRREIVEWIGAWALDRRLGAEIAAGRASFLQADVSVDDWPQTLRMVSVQASGRPGTWQAMLKELGAELQRARLHGFTERELRDARAMLIAGAEEAVRREATRPAREVIGQLNADVSRGRPSMSAAQRLALLQRLLPGITVAEVSDTFRATFDPGRALFIAQLPVADDVPGEAQLLALGRGAVDVKPDKPADVARAETLLAALPPGGAVVERVTHAASGVTSMWLDNGVRAHHRRVDQRKNEAIVEITLAGGVIEETPATRGLTEAALRAWTRPATSRLSSTEIRDLMTGAKVRVRSGISGDTISLTVAGDVAELERGLQLVYLLLTDPLVEAAALEQWRDAEAQRLRDRKSQPMQALMDTAAAGLYPPDESRPKSLTAEQLAALTRLAAQAWLARLVREAPIEVAVVGDLEREPATALVTRYLGALPARPRIDDKTLAMLRTITRPAGPIRTVQSIDAMTPQGATMIGFYGADLRNRRETRLLGLAARVLSTRMLESIREERGLVYSIHASSEVAVVYPGFGRFVAVAPTEPAKAAALVTAVEEMFAAFGKDGPSAEELRVAKKQTANLLDEVMKTPEFWAGYLATLDYRGLSLDDILDGPAQYQRFTAAEVRETFAHYARPDAHFHFVITPR